MESSDILMTYVSELVSTHLGHAVNMYCEAKKKRHGPTRNGHCISSIIHSVSAIESCTDMLYYYVFKNPDSVDYIPSENRDVPLNRMIHSWWNVQTIDKINLFINLSNKKMLDKSVQDKFKELNSLRNLLVHGTCYETTYLVDEITEDGFTTSDSSDSIDWAKKFPINRFNSIKELNDTDAYKALTIAIEIIKILAFLYNASICLLIENRKEPIVTLNKNSNVEDLLY